jgi:hypothetical protein
MFSACIESASFSQIRQSRLRRKNDEFVTFKKTTANTPLAYRLDNLSRLFEPRFDVEHKRQLLNNAPTSGTAMQLPGGFGDCYRRAPIFTIV